MKLLLYRYGSICEPDIISGLQELGHTVSELTEEVYNKELLPGDIARITGAFLLEHPQDAVFSINFFPTVSDVCNIFKIPYICWIVDSPVMELFSKSVQNPCNRIFVFDRQQYSEIASLNPGRIFHYPLAVNVTSKQAAIQTATSEDRLRFASEISFVGSLYTEKSPYDKLTGVSDYTSGYLDALMESQLNVYGYYFIEECLTQPIIEDFKKHMPNYYEYPRDNFLTDKITIAQLYIGNKISSLERTRIMALLSEYFSVDLYTGSDTTKLPKINNRGFAKTLTEMPIIFHESNINLNPTSKAIRSGIPLRVFDIFACEGFMLSNYQPELAEYFVAGLEYDYYTSMEELLEKTYYYLNHEKERVEIAHNAFEKVSAEYNYPKRLVQLLNIALSATK